MQNENGQAEEEQVIWFLGLADVIPMISLSFPGSVKWKKKQGRSLGDKFLQLVVHPQNQIPVTCKSIKRIHFLKQINYVFIQKQKIEKFFKNIWKIESIFH